VNLSTAARYLFGNRSAIEAVAQSSAALPFGIGLVLLTAVARNYDQNCIGESTLWLLGPLLFSFASGAWLFFILYDRCVKRFLTLEVQPEGVGQWRSFMGLFWMTAPIAWLYAIPVERFFDPIGAAKANITLLAIVSLWRVLLMARVISVVNDVPFLRALGWVLVGAALEVIIVVFLGGLFGGSFGKRILAGMSGMRNAPDETLLLNALGFSWNGAWVVLFVTLVLLGVFRYSGTSVPFPSVSRERVPWFSLLALAAIWSAVAWPAQQEQRRFQEHARLLAAKKYQDALSYLSQHQQGDFPASRRLEPNPYEYRVWHDLPPTIALLSTNTPFWVRATYLKHLSATFDHFSSRYDSLTNVAQMYSSIARLPEGREWLRTNEANFVRHQELGRRADPGDPAERHALASLVSSLSALGMSDTNLALLAK
jgi:hypothetical protein